MAGAFGSFDPGFYGVRATLWSRDDIATLSRYVEQDDVHAWAHGETATGLDRLGPLSAVDHEIRHFHDALLSPWGANIMGLRMQVLLNGAQAMDYLRGAAGALLPTPLSRWLRWDATERQRWVDETGRPFGIGDLAAFVDLPVSSPGAPPDLESEAGVAVALALGSIAAHERLARFRQRMDCAFGLGTIGADDAFEGAAHLVQGQAIWQGQGEAAARAYLDHLETADLAYLGPWRLLQRWMSDGDQPPRVAGMLAAYCWTLLSPPDALPGRGDPAWRLLALLALAEVDAASLRGDWPAAALWDMLDDRLRTPGWRDSLAAADAMAARRRAVYQQARAQMTGRFAAPVLDTAIKWLDDRQRLVDAVRADPDAYVDPARYLNGTVGALPLPCLQIRFGALAHRRTTPVDSPNLRAETLDEAGLDVIAYVAAMTPANAPALDAIVDHALFNALVDHCFFEPPGDDLLDRHHRAILTAELGKDLVLVY